MAQEGEAMSKIFFVSQESDAYPVKVVLSRSNKYVFLFHDERLVLSLSANDIFLIKDEIDTERGYKELVRVYLMRLIDKMEPAFELALGNEEYVEDVAEKYAKQVRGISILTLTEEMRQSFFEEAFRQVDYRFYLKKNDGETRVGA